MVKISILIPMDKRERINVPIYWFHEHSNSVVFFVAILFVDHGVHKTGVIVSIKVKILEVCKSFTKILGLAFFFNFN